MGAKTITGDQNIKTNNTSNGRTKHSNKKRRPVVNSNKWFWKTGQKLQPGHRVTFHSWDRRNTIVSYHGTVRRIDAKGILVSVPMKSGHNLMYAHEELIQPQEVTSGKHRHISVIRR